MTFFFHYTVHHAEFFSTNRDRPHVVTVIENMSTAIDCGPFSNTPPSGLTWDVEFGNVLVPISLGNERATVGLNQSLYLLEPRASQDGDLFACHSRNSLLGIGSDGFLRISVQGMCWSACKVHEPQFLVRLLKDSIIQQFNFMECSDDKLWSSSHKKNGCYWNELDCRELVSCAVCPLARLKVLGSTNHE